MCIHLNLMIFTKIIRGFISAKRFNIHDDQKMVLDFLLQEKVLLVQGTAFNWPWPDHFRIVTLPREDDLEMAINRFGRFLSGYHQ